MRLEPSAHADHLNSYTKSITLIMKSLNSNMLLFHTLYYSDIGEYGVCPQRTSCDFAVANANDGVSQHNSALRNHEDLTCIDSTCCCGPKCKIIRV